MKPERNDDTGFIVKRSRLTVRRSGEPDIRTVDAWFIGCSVPRERRQSCPYRCNKGWQLSRQAGGGVFSTGAEIRTTPITATINFSSKGLRRSLRTLQKRKVGFVLRRYPDHGLLRFCSEVRPCLVIADENPLMEAERTKTRIAEKIVLPFWTVDSRRGCAVKAAYQRALRGADDPSEDPRLVAAIYAKGRKSGGEVSMAQPIRTCRLWCLIHALLDDFPIDRGVAPSAYFPWRLPRSSALSRTVSSIPA